MDKLSFSYTQYLVMNFTIGEINTYNDYAEAFEIYSQCIEDGHSVALHRLVATNVPKNEI